MNNNEQLGSFGLGWTFFGDIRLVKDSQGNVTILNSGIQSLLPNQLPGTALYQPGSQISPSEELLNNPYNLSNQSLIGGSASSRLFSLQTDGSYQAGEKDKGTLTKVGDIYQLKEKDGTVIVFRSDGQLDYVQDTNGYRISATYNNNTLTTLSDSSGEYFNFTYNSQGRINNITDSSGQATNYTYDQLGQNLLSVQDTRGTTQFTYDNPFDPSLVTSVTYADGTKIFYDYDQIGRIQQIIQGEGQQALIYTYTYDDLGGYIFKDSNGAITTVTYDENTKTRTITDPLNRTFQYTYDAAGMLDTITAPDGSIVDYNFCGCGQLRSSIDPLGNVTTFDYETNFNKISQLTDARGNDILYSYDTKGNLASITYEDGTHQDYSYNIKGQLTQSTNRRSQDITYEYNNNYQITQEIHSDGTIITYEYGATNGLLTYFRNDSSGTITRINYDQAKNTVTVENSIGLVHTYKFDTLGRKIQIIIQDSANTYTTNYSYDSLGRLDKLTDGSGNLIVDYDYHAAFTASTVGIDQIADFMSGTDKIVLDKTTFTALASIAGNGFDIDSEFAIVSDDSMAQISIAKIIYSSGTGNLFYNQNGVDTGFGTGSQFATLASVPTITENDFILQV